ncbi:hypothetical protein [Aurantiacibacter poecillastricola]|uniref:hypothetical protein n=1 Tax=Aurantiacibacter poecillastricola TaxID=3064385 RepID=UPI00273D1D6C|nr:hypothetical protein [Aurantiacibacter sp. 219JJ12-13]MDP5260820.1 hypothetical protein [Aurantiacibacter sp. 219JJ12-13]
MGEYEPRDSRNVTLKQGHEPGSAKRTGPQEDEARAEAKRREAEKAEEKRKKGSRDASRRSQYDPAER